MSFFTDVPVRIAVPCMPPVGFDPRLFAANMADRIDDAGLHEYFTLERHAIEGQNIYFYLRTDRHKNELKKSLRHEKRWLLLLKKLPEARLEFAEDLENQK